MPICYGICLSLDFQADAMTRKHFPYCWPLVVSWRTRDASVMSGIKYYFNLFVLHTIDEGIDRSREIFFIHCNLSQILTPLVIPHDINKMVIAKVG